MYVRYEFEMRYHWDMSKKAVCLLTPLMIILSSYSFGQTDTISVFFANDNSTAFDAKVIDDISGTLPLLDGISVIGYTDHLGSSAYNQELSYARADQVARYLMSQGLNKRKLTEVRGAGEIPGNGPGIPDHRRVDIIIPVFDKPAKASPPSQPQAQREEPKPVIADEVIEIDTVSKENIVLEGLSFIGGRHFPTPESMPVLERLVETMRRYPNLTIEIQGHICCEYNQFDGMDMDSGEMKLSENRAKYVYKYLIQNGISSTRMTYVGKGSSDPKVYPERTEEDRQTNRRVELKIVNF